jgi:hypothetical protein
MPQQAGDAGRGGGLRPAELQFECGLRLPSVAVRRVYEQRAVHSKVHAQTHTARIRDGRTSAAARARGGRAEGWRGKEEEQLLAQRRHVGQGQAFTHSQKSVP